MKYPGQFSFHVAKRNNKPYQRQAASIPLISLPLSLSLTLQMDMISENENECDVTNLPVVSKKLPKQHFKVCFCFKRIFKHRIYEPPEDIKKLFERYSENGTMTVEHLQRFLIEVQEESNASKDSAQAIFNSLKHLNVFPRKGLSFEAFYRYLLSDRNSAIRRVVHQDMQAPLAHYFIFTSHNSYLTGNQLSSDCSEVPIIAALKKGVKVIELDLWPNDREDGVEVRHGGTLTRPVELIKCLKAIKDNAFSVSDYPVVITFEDHLTPDLQSIVAQMVTKTFGELLYRSESHLKEFPSPESLKKKILISTKPPKELHEASSSAKDETWNVNGEHEEVASHDRDDPTGEENAVPQYKNLIAIHAGKPKGGKDIWAIDPNKVRRLSLSEQELEDAVYTRGTDIVRFTQKNLLRVYPKGLRFDSSNYDPMLGWMHGAQMVAFNMQGYGKYLWIMQGMFRANGGCGYVKKPDFLLEVTPSDEVFDPANNIPPIQKILKVKVYLGEGWHSDFRHTHFDRFSPPDFFVRVGIDGVPDDKVMEQTKAIEDEWLPVWNEEFEFKLRVPELAILRIEILEYDTSGKHDFGGQTCLPVSELRTGIRVIPLHNKKGDKYYSTKLLMRFEFLPAN
ncbi:phosphoinositide phospholipase C 2-like [Carya illinoinensis]|uniref:phosphoinositide phospholipase C 2-like n=1 Tax=Carya illinoinensis TaxID=32201 RepID=UPI001C71D6F9|nr:phosphoinositide phospholipase C 2-like [Carya illinoinensis]